MTKESVAIARSYLSRKRRRVGGGSAGRREERDDRWTTTGRGGSRRASYSIDKLRVSIDLHSLLSEVTRPVPADSSFSLTATSSCAELKDSVSSDKEKLAAMFSKPIHAWLRLPSQAFVDQVVLGSGSSAASSEEGDSDAPPPSSCSSSSSGSLASSVGSSLAHRRPAQPVPRFEPLSSTSPLRPEARPGSRPTLASKALRFNPNKPAACPATAELQVLLRAASTGTEAHGPAGSPARAAVERAASLTSPSTFTAAHCLLSVACPGL
eukprot:tig00020911_g15732.t1